MAAARKRTQEEKNLRTLRELASLPANKQCFDCHQRGPTYVNMTVGSFVCTSCSGMLRGLNPPHRVKSITMTVFTPEEIEFIRDKGNEYCRYIWLGTYDTRSMLLEPEPRDEQKVKDFMIQKYERKRWYVDPDKAIRNMQDHAHHSGIQSATGSSGPSSQSSTPLSEHIPETKPLSTLLGKSTTPLVVQNTPAQLVSSNSWINPNHLNNSKPTMQHEKSVDALFGSSDFFGSPSANQTSNPGIMGSTQATAQPANSVSYSIANGNFANFESAFNDCARPSSLPFTQGSSPQAYSFSDPVTRPFPPPSSFSSPHSRVEASTTNRRKAFTPPPGWMSFEDDSMAFNRQASLRHKSASNIRTNALPWSSPCDVTHSEPLSLISSLSELTINPPYAVSVVQSDSQTLNFNVSASAPLTPIVHSHYDLTPNSNPFTFFPESSCSNIPTNALSYQSSSSYTEASPSLPRNSPFQFPLTPTSTVTTPTNPFSYSSERDITSNFNRANFPDVGPTTPSQPRPFFPATPTSKSFGMFSPVSSSSASSTFSGNTFETTTSPSGSVTSPPKQTAYPPAADRYAALADLDSLFHQEPAQPATPPAPASSWVGTSATVTLSNNNNNSSSLFGNPQQPNSIFAVASANPFTSTTSTWSSSNNSVNPNQAVYPVNPFQAAPVANPPQSVGYGQFGLNNQQTVNGPVVDNYTNFSQIPPVNMQPMYFNNTQGLVGSPNGIPNQQNQHQQNGSLGYQWGGTTTNQITSNNGWGMVGSQGQMGAFQNTKILANSGLGQPPVQMPANPFMSNAVSNAPRSNPSNPFL